MIEEQREEIGNLGRSVSVGVMHWYALCMYAYGTKHVRREQRHEYEVISDLKEKTSGGQFLKYLFG